MPPDTFEINFASGEIRPSDSLTNAQKVLAQKTIDTLKLNSEDCKSMRCSRFDEYLSQNVTSVYLKNRSPFVHREADRQGLL
jgi:hypothetical protein